jgi:hypothetical protein
MLLCFALLQLVEFRFGESFRSHHECPMIFWLCGVCSMPFPPASKGVGRQRAVVCTWHNFLLFCRHRLGIMSFWLEHGLAGDQYG